MPVEARHMGHRISEVVALLKIPGFTKVKGISRVLRGKHYLSYGKTQWQWSSTSAEISRPVTFAQKSTCEYTNNSYCHIQ